MEKKVVIQDLTREIQLMIESSVTISHVLITSRMLFKFKDELSENDYFCLLLSVNKKIKEIEL